MTPSYKLTLSLATGVTLKLVYVPAGESQTCRQVADHAKRIYDAKFDYPVILSSAGWVMDGMHRVCKAYLLGWQAIKAVQFIQDPEPDEVVHC